MNCGPYVNNNGTTHNGYDVLQHLYCEEIDNWNSLIYGTDKKNKATSGTFTNMG